MEISITLNETELVSLISEMRETGKEYAGHQFKMERDDSSVRFYLSQDIVDEFLEEIKKLKSSKSFERSVVVDQIVVSSGVDCMLSFLLIPEYRVNIFKGAILKK